MGFPTYKPPITLISCSSRTPSPTPSPSTTSSSTSRRHSRARRPTHLRTSQAYLSPYTPVNNGARAVRHRQQRRFGRQRTRSIEPQIPRDLTTAAFLASSFQINTTPRMTTISFSKPLIGTYPTLSVESHVPATHVDRTAMEIDDRPLESNEVDDIPADLFSIEFMHNNRGLAMEVLLGNLAGDESFADLFGLTPDMFSEQSDEEDSYEDDVDLDMDLDRTDEGASEGSSAAERSLRGDILRGVDEDYD